MTCLVCGTERFNTKTVAGVTIRRCRACGLRTMPVGEQKGTNYADLDAEVYLQAIGSVRQAQGEEIVAFARRHGAKGEWLDVGCGYGYVLDAARAAGFGVRGIEPNATAVQAARARGINVSHGYLDEHAPSADIVSTLDVLEHLDDINAFAELVKAKTRGLWVIKVPSSDGLFFRIAHALRLRGAVERLWQTECEHPHTVYFDESTLTRFLRNHGFDIVAIRYLDEMPTRTVVPRLTLMRAMPRGKARLVVPLVFVVNVIERLRGRSDALAVIAKPRTVRSADV